MTEAQAIELVFARWVSVWPGLHPEVPFTLDNEASTASDLWARISFQHNTGIQISQGGIGTRRFEYTGVIWVQLFGAVDRGRKPLSDLVPDIQTVFDSLSLASPVVGDEPLTTGAAATRESPTDNRWVMQSSLIPARYYQLR